VGAGGVDHQGRAAAQGARAGLPLAPGAEDTVAATVGGKVSMKLIKVLFYVGCCLWPRTILQILVYAVALGAWLIYYPIGTLLAIIALLLVLILFALLGFSIEVK
jgi:hypothetical protein